MSDNTYLYLDVRDNWKFSKQKKSQRIKPNFDLEKENGEIIYGRELSYLGRGCNSTVWKYESEKGIYAIKIFFNTCLWCGLKEDVLKIVKKLPLKKTINVFETLKVLNGDGIKSVGHDAYIMEFLEEQKDYSIVEMPTSKLLENTGDLESDGHLLACNNILMNDVRMKNTIFKKGNGMFYLSDLDGFLLSDSESIDGQNQTELQFIYYQFFTQYSSAHYNGIYNDLFEELFFQDTTNEKTITEKLKDLFSSYDMPKQFFKDNKRKYGNKYF